MGEGTVFSLSVHTRGGGGREGGYPIPSLGRGVPHLRSGQGGYPISGLGRGVPHPRSRWGGTHSTSPRIASTCYGYMAGGMPLAFMQEDFLVLLCWCSSLACFIVSYCAGPVPWTCSIVSYCAGAVPCTCPDPISVSCSVNKPLGPRLHTMRLM